MLLLPKQSLAWSRVVSIYTTIPSTRGTRLFYLTFADGKWGDENTDQMVLHPDFFYVLSLRIPFAETKCVPEPLKQRNIRSGYVVLIRGN